MIFVNEQEKKQQQRNIIATVSYVSLYLCFEHDIIYVNAFYMNS